MSETDLIVVGGGLAGCTLAWQAKLRGLRIAVIDESRSDSSSRVAAGLVTPITGSRLAISWRWQEFFSMADRFYRLIQDKSATQFWRVEPALRVFTSEAESSSFYGRWCSETGQTILHDNDMSLQPIDSSFLKGLKPGFGGMVMSPSARLDTVRYLDATHRTMREQDELHEVKLECDRDIVATSDQFRIPSLGLTARWVVLCQGFAARENSWFDRLPLHPARGDILEIHSRAANFDRVVHHTAWAVPLEQHRFLVGATYDRHCSDTRIDHELALRFRSVLCERWQSMTGENLIDSAVAILKHRAAIRPASYDRHPLLGRHGTLKNLFCFNGLGSKGSLMAPSLANQLLASILHGHEIDPLLRWDRRANP